MSNYTTILLSDKQSSDMVMLTWHSEIMRNDRSLSYISIKCKQWFKIYL